MKKQFLLLFFTATSIWCFSQTLPSYVPTNGLAAWYSFSGNTNDLSGNGHSLVNHGAILTTDRCGNANSAYSFDGDTSFLVSIDSFFNNGWTNFSISLWLKSDSTTNPMGDNQSQTMFNTVPHYGTELSYGWGGVTNYDFFYNSNPNGGGWDEFSNLAALSHDTVTEHVWNHIVLVKNDTVYQLYVNGALDNTFYNSTAAINYLCQIYIGNISEYGDEGFWGSLDDYGIWNRPLTSAEVLALYNASCNNSLPACIPASGLIAWYPFSGSTTDATGNGHNLINNGAVLTTDRCGNANSAYAFDGDATFMASIDTFFDNGWPNFSITLWLNSNDTTNPMGNNQSQTMFNTTPHYGTELSYGWGGEPKYDFFYNAQSPYNYDWSVFSNEGALSQTSVTAHVWNHIALVKSDTIYKLYVNGALNNTFSSPQVAISYLCGIYIGNISEFGNETFWGSLDDYGIWNRSLSAAEVLQVYQACCTPSGIAPIVSSSASISIYPNPANDKITIKRDAATASEPYTIADLTGRVIQTGQAGAGTTTINITTLSPSIYVIQIGNENKQSLKFVKN